MPAWESEARRGYLPVLLGDSRLDDDHRHSLPGQRADGGARFSHLAQTRETDIEGGELWLRAFYASFALAALIALFVGLDWLLADLAEFPAGPIHIIVFVGFVALAAYVLVYIFSLDDYFEGLSLLIIYLFLPLLVLFGLNYLLGLVNPSLRLWDHLVNLANAWLVKPPT